jgi:catecholate siderophore receptor
MRSSFPVIHERMPHSSIQSSERWRIQVNMQNIFNRKYYLTADGNNNISPGVPASGRIALIARF